MHVVVGIAATTLGALPFAYRLYIVTSTLDGSAFYVPLSLFAVCFVSILVICCVSLFYADETSMSCVIAKALLLPGLANTLLYTIDNVR